MRRTDRVRDGETPQALGIRLGVPLCMILRANRLLCAAWLTPGREIDVPQGDFCMGDAFPCPADLVRTQAREEKTEICIVQEGDSVRSLARALGTSERLLLRARKEKGVLRDGERIVLEATKCSGRIKTVLPGEDIEEFCKRCAVEMESAAGLNELQNGRIWPGMRLVLPE